MKFEKLTSHVSTEHCMRHNKHVSTRGLLCVQFDGKGNCEAYVTPDGEPKSMPLEVLKSKKALTGKEQALQMIEDLTIKSKQVLVVCSDTTAVDSGTGKVSGACFGNVSLSLFGMSFRYGLN